MKKFIKYALSFACVLQVLSSTYGMEGQDQGSSSSVPINPVSQPIVTEPDFVSATTLRVYCGYRFKSNGRILPQISYVLPAGSGIPPSNYVMYPSYLTRDSSQPTERVSSKNSTNQTVQQS